MPNPPILATATLPEFFREKVVLAIQTEKVSVSPHVEFYLVNLLTTFTQAEKFFKKNEKALALRFLDSLLATPTQKIPILKQMGDLALYTSGFFSESLLKKMAGLDYYIQMGHTAYSSLSHIAATHQGKDFKGLFEELAMNFIHLVNVLSHIADSTHLNTSQDLLKFYERWLVTGCKRSQQILSEQGIIPDKNLQSKYSH